MCRRCGAGGALYVRRWDPWFARPGMAAYGSIVIGVLSWNERSLERAPREGMVEDEEEEGGGSANPGGVVVRRRFGLACETWRGQDWVSRRRHDRHTDPSGGSWDTRCFIIECA